MVALDGTVRLVALQFSFSNPAVIPPSIRQWRGETPREALTRKSQATGEVIIEPTPNCYVAEFLGELEAAGYELVSMRYEERINQKKPRKTYHEERINQKETRKTYHMVRFVFARSEFVDVSDEFRSVRDAFRADLRAMCEVALWRVRGFLNPFYKDGEEVSGQRMMNINLEARNPLLHPDGTLRMEWRKDAGGNRMGDAPVPLRPEYMLRIAEGAVSLQAAGEDFAPDLDSAVRASGELAEMFGAILDVMSSGLRVEGAREEEEYIFSILEALESVLSEPMTLPQMVGAVRREHRNVLKRWQGRGFSASYLWGLLEALVHKGVLRSAGTAGRSYQFDADLLRGVMGVREAGVVVGQSAQ